MVLALLSIPFSVRVGAAAVSSPSEVGRIAAGDAHTCAIASNDVVWCWGDNTYSQLGSSAHASIPNGYALSPVQAAALPGGRVARRITSGRDHVCVLADDGTVWCWGDNSFGQLGVAGGNQPDPVQVTLGGVATLIAAGGNTTCAALANNSVYCWGRNNRGQLGKGSASALAQATPTAVTSIPSQFIVSSLDVGALHACATSTVGDSWCWGAFDNGRLGTNGSSDVFTPQRISTLASGLSADVAAGFDHTCAVVGASVWCFGRNNNGQLGIDPAVTSEGFPPSAVQLSANARSVHVGTGFSCVVLVTNTVECFGLNDNGQLGDTTMNSPRYMSAGVSGLSANIVDVAIGASHACAVTDAGAVKCWGLNSLGQLGDSTQTRRLAAVTIASLTVSPTTTTTTTTSTSSSSTSSSSSTTSSTSTTVAPTTTTPSNQQPSSVAARVLRVKRNRFITARAIAAHVSLTIPKTSQGSMRFTIVRGSRYCTFVGTRVKGIRKGTCSVLVTRIPKRGTRTLKTAKIVVS